MNLKELIEMSKGQLIGDVDLNLEIKNFSIDSRVIGSGKRGPVSHELQGAYFDIVMGKNPKYEHLLTYIN